MEKMIYYIQLVVLFVAGCLVLSPCLLMFTTGHEGEPTIWNVVGVAWLYVLYRIVKIICKWTDC
jgi:hypothetical protein